MAMVDLIWNRLLGIPLNFLATYLHFDMITPGKVIAWKLVIIGLILFLLYELYLRVKVMLRRRRRQSMMDDVIIETGVVKDQEFAQKLDAVHAPEQTIAALKRQKQWARAGEIYASLNRNKEAAKMFQKGGDKKRAAMEWAKAGKTLKAARLLSRQGDHGTAARFYAEKGKHLKAAQAYAQLNDLPNAADSYARAKKYPEAAEAFRNFLQTPGANPGVHAAAAEKCYAFLQHQEAREKIGAESTSQLLILVANSFAAAHRDDLAGQLYVQAGDFARAGQIYARAGQLERAAECMARSGNTKEAAEFLGRNYEAKGEWRKAAEAYEKAEHWLRAGDCYSKANDPVQSAQAYEKAGEYFGAGFALIHASKWESAIRVFQHVPETHKNFAESRALLGRCFYELKDYAHCAATLENHLMGERVRTGNIEYFWMLALAYEQLGELDKSKDVLLKIRSVNVGFRDVSQRLSNIQSRISMLGSKAGVNQYAMPTSAGSRPSNDATAVMTMVEDTLGQRYKLEKELGRGGMGVVYYARDTQLDRPVALKFLGSLVDGNEEFHQRFIREAKAAAKVSHPNIVSIYEINTQEGRAFIAMEFVEGANLHRYLKQKKKLEPREAVNIMAQACSALQAIHDVGIVHRDIKPDNIVITKGGLVKLMDFGLAKTANNRLTAANVIMGTPSYMSPEQTRGIDVDGRSDIYSIGLVFHELLTGETCFVDGDVLKRQQTELPPPPSAKVEGISAELDAVVMKAIAKNPDERYTSAREFIDALRTVAR